jgi:acetamidase/formamidase
MQSRLGDSNKLQPQEVPLAGLPNPTGSGRHWYVPASDQTVHWGYFSKSLKPLIEVGSGDYVTLECLTHQAGDDPARLLTGDAGAESVYHWTRDQKNVDRRGAGPMDAANGAGGGQGVHILTGPVYVRGAAPGDLLEVRILDMYPRACANPAYASRFFGTNLAGNWGYHYHDLIEQPRPREVVTIYEIETGGEFARPLYNYRWGPVTDPNGIVHKLYDYPGLIVDPAKFQPREGILKNVRVPIRPHFGTLGLAPREAELVSSIPPNYTGGNIDDWRIGKGATLYYPVAVDGALLSAGDTHAAQGDAELCGTAIESSWTGVFQIVLHKSADIADRSALSQVRWPLLETRDEWVIHGFSYPHYLTDLGAHAQRDIFTKSSVDLAMRDAFRKIREFLMHTQGCSEDEAISLISVAVDFGVTQVVDGNWGVHASLKKSIFADRR